MRLGMNVLLWTDDACREDMLPVYERLAELGYEGVELPIFGGPTGAFAALGRRLDDLGLARTAVTVRSEADNPSSAWRSVRAAGQASTRAVLDCCQAVGAELVCGPFYAALGAFDDVAAREEQWAYAVEAVREMAEYAEGVDVDLMVEPLNRFEVYLLNSAADGARFVREVGHPRCRMLYDTFHAHIEEKSVDEALQSCRDAIGHVHISECDRSTPGRGQVRWDETFAALRRIGYDGWLTVEAFGQRLPALAAATKIWRPMFSDEMQLAQDALAFVRERWQGVPAWV